MCTTTTPTTWYSMLTHRLQMKCSLPVHPYYARNCTLEAPDTLQQHSQFTTWYIALRSAHHQQSSNFNQYIIKCRDLAFFLFCSARNGVTGKFVTWCRRITCPPFISPSGLVLGPAVRRTAHPRTSCPPGLLILGRAVPLPDKCS